MDKLIHDMMKEGKDINEILNMPFSFVIDVMESKNKPTHKKSLAEAFGG